MVENKRKEYQQKTTCRLKGTSISKGYEGRQWVVDGKE
jgi:hypothetical protein